MKKTLILLLACLSVITLRAQRPAAQPSLPALRGNTVRFETLDGTTGSAYYVPSRDVATSALILFHNWWGLTDQMRREADRWQDSLGAVDVYAIDLYDGKVAATEEQGTRYAASLDDRRTDVLIRGLLVQAGKDKRIASLGWGVGGNYAFRAAVLAENRAAGCVMYYGYPEKDVKKIAPLQCDVLYIRAQQDQYVSQLMLSAFAEQVTKTGRAFELQPYPMRHAFAEPGSLNFDALTAEAAQQRALAFLRHQLAL